jgi:hypothetical protein
MVALHRDEMRRTRDVPPDLRIVEADVPVRVRKDMLPDGTDYEDTGCELAKSCLRCPFSRCKYDAPGGGRRLSTQERDREMALLHEKHRLSISLLAFAYGVTRRTVFRALLRHGCLLDRKRTSRRRKRVHGSARQLPLGIAGAPPARMSIARNQRHMPERGA